MFQSLAKRLIAPAIEQALANHVATRGDSRNRQYESIERLRGMAVATGLKHLFSEPHFNICQLDSCIAAAKIIPDGEVYRAMRPLHCVKWMDMKPELRDEVFSQVVRMFGVDLETA